MQIENDNHHPQIRYARVTNEDTGEVTQLFLHSHAEIDAEIDSRLRWDDRRGVDRIEHHEATRARFHRLLSLKTDQLFGGS